MESRLQGCYFRACKLPKCTADIKWVRVGSRLGANPLSSDNYMERQLLELMLLPLKESEEMRNATAVKLYQHGIFL